MKIIHCKFCNKNISNCIYQQPKGDDWARYKCKSCISGCVCYFHVTNSGDITEYQFNYRDYCFRFNLIQNTFKMFSSKAQLKDLIVLDTIPNITPLNVEQKLPTLLTFL